MSRGRGSVLKLLEQIPSSPPLPLNGGPGELPPEFFLNSTLLQASFSAFLSEEKQSSWNGFVADTIESGFDSAHHWLAIL